MAQGTSRCKNSTLRQFYLQIKDKKGHKVAIVALSKKILCIIYHLLITGERYVEEGVNKKSIKLSLSESTDWEIKRAIHTLRKAGYTVSAG